MHAGGQRFESVILHVGAIAPAVFDMMYGNYPARFRAGGVEAKKDCAAPFCWGPRQKKQDKGVRRMPRLSEAMKDVTSCDKPRGGAGDL